jgi:hypothetical protein
MKRIFFVLIAVVLISSYACKKEAGEGGNSSITGKIRVKDYNSAFTILNSEYAGYDQDVYIIYGDDVSYGDKTSTNPEGVFEFKYLRKGDYTVYVYSKDTTRNSFGTLQVYTKAIKVQTNISKNKQTVDIGTITIND